MLEQAACDELLGRLHHVLPHFKRSTLLIEECESLISAHGAALFFSQAHEMRKCDFSDHAFSVFLIGLVGLVGHCLAPHWFCFSGNPDAGPQNPFSADARGECNPANWNCIYWQ